MHQSSQLAQRNIKSIWWKNSNSHKVLELPIHFGILSLHCPSSLQCISSGPSNILLGDAHLKQIKSPYLASSVLSVVITSPKLLIIGHFTTEGKKKIILVNETLEANSCAVAQLFLMFFYECHNCYRFLLVGTSYCNVTIILYRITDQPCPLSPISDALDSSVCVCWGV